MGVPTASGAFFAAARWDAIGTFRTCDDVRLESAKRTKADIEQTSRNDRV